MSTKLQLVIVLFMFATVNGVHIGYMEPTAEFAERRFYHCPTYFRYGKDTLSTTQLCDLQPECLDGRDEKCAPCQTGVSHFGRAEIPLDLFCDGYQDCVDDSDELNCPRSSQCPPDHFYCDFRCISSQHMCDGVSDCRSGVDEDFDTCHPSPVQPISSGAPSYDDMKISSFFLTTIFLTFVNNQL